MYVWTVLSHRFPPKNGYNTGITNVFPIWDSICLGGIFVPRNVLRIFYLMCIYCTCIIYLYIYLYIKYIILYPFQQPSGLQFTQTAKSTNIHSLFWLEDLIQQRAPCAFRAPWKFGDSTAWSFQHGFRFNSLHFQGFFALILCGWYGDANWCDSPITKGGLIQQMPCQGPFESTFELDKALRIWSPKLDKLINPVVEGLF